MWMKGAQWLCIFIVSLSTDSSLSISTFTHSHTTVPVSLSLCLSSFWRSSILPLFSLHPFVFAFHLPVPSFLPSLPPSFLCSWILGVVLFWQNFLSVALSSSSSVLPSMNEPVLWRETRTSLFQSALGKKHTDTQAALTCTHTHTLHKHTDSNNMFRTCCIKMWYEPSWVRASELVFVLNLDPVCQSGRPLPHPQDANTHTHTHVLHTFYVREHIHVTGPTSK